MGVGRCRARIPRPTVTVANGGQHLPGPVPGAGIVSCAWLARSPVRRRLVLLIQSHQVLTSVLNP